jgi:hypothetical protein
MDKDALLLSPEPCGGCVSTPDLTDFFAKNARSRFISWHRRCVQSDFFFEGVYDRANMPIDDELEKSAVAAEIREASERTIQQMLLKSGVGGAISLIPFVGSTINHMLTQLAARRANERMEQMFDEMAGHIRNLGEGKISRDWFRGEEFQTLLFEALHQLHVTDDKRKIEMLGKALANSGAIEFKDESRKQLFLQLVRTLTPQHIVALRELLPRTRPKHLTPESCPDWHLWQQRPSVTGRNLLVLQTLAANGLVEESLESAAKRPSVGQYASRRN